MATILNAQSGVGLTQSADGSGIVKLQSNGVTTNALAWVNFNGTLATPITPRSAYNVSSVTKSSTGVYVINYATALSDANYSSVVGWIPDTVNTSGIARYITVTAQATGTINITSGAWGSGGLALDFPQLSIAIFGN